MNILVSACLLGEKCRYDGKSKGVDAVINLGKTHNLIPCCPEVDGGLLTPRPPAEIKGNLVINKEGKDVTENYLKGAEIALKKAKENGCETAILKAKSPSCSNCKVYDGTFTKTLTDGMGICAKLLCENGITVLNENEIDTLLLK